MGGFEKSVEAYRATLLPKVATILKTLYDEDIVDEEIILEWGKKVSKKYVKDKELGEQVKSHIEARSL